MFRSGDILAFSGRGSTSLAIRLATCSPVSHVACVAEVGIDQVMDLKRVGKIKQFPAELRGSRCRTLLFESTTLNTEPCVITGQRIRGVQAHDPAERVAAYDGRVWRYTLTDDWRERFEAEDGPRRLAKYLLERIGEAYDTREALIAGTWFLKRWWYRATSLLPWSRLKRNKRLFCSEYNAGVLQLLRLFPIENPAKVTPASMIATLTESNIYDEPKLLKA